MAEAVKSETAAAPRLERPVEQAPAPSRRRERYEKLRPRFAAAYILLAVVVGAAVGGLVVYLGTRGDETSATGVAAVTGTGFW